MSYELERQPHHDASHVVGGGSLTVPTTRHQCKSDFSLWGDIGLAHEKDKQEFGGALVITGFFVDPHKKVELVSAIRDTTDSVRGRKCKLND
jgi:hypothetical protein